MAEQTYTLKLTWQNGADFKMTSKLGAAATITIVQMDENGHIGGLWPHVEEICRHYLGHKLTEIGLEMQA